MNGLYTELMIKQRVAQGVMIMGVRRVIIQLILSTTNIVLARVLFPKIFGEFAIISFLIMTFGTLTNCGLTTALVQNKDAPTQGQLRSVFTIIIIASLLFIGFIFITAPIINSFYHGELGAGGIFWLRLFSTVILLENLTAISARLLERNLEYKKLTSAEVFTELLTQILIVVFAIRGLGLGSFVLGQLLGGVAGFILSFYLSPWVVGVSFSFKELKKFMSFGINYQANTLIGIINGAVLPIFVGLTSGAREVGLVSWAGGIRQSGLAPLEVSQKLIFPAVSRTQDKPKFLKILIEKLLELSCMLSFPLLTGIIALAPSFTSIIFTQLWLSGLTALYLSLIQGIFMVYSSVLMDSLLALGKARTVRNITLLWAILQWLLTIPLVLTWNFNGVVLAGLIVSATFFIPLAKLRNVVDVDIWSASLPYLGYAIVSGITMFILSYLIHINSIVELLSIGLVGMLVYLILLFILRREALIEDWHIFQKLAFVK